MFENNKNNFKSLAIENVYNCIYLITMDSFNNNKLQKSQTHV